MFTIMVDASVAVQPCRFYDVFIIYANPMVANGLNVEKDIHFANCITVFEQFMNVYCNRRNFYPFVEN